MDPDATLAELRAAMENLAAATLHPPVDTTQIQEAAELFDALDEWLTGDGFLPRSWDTAAPTTEVNP